MTGIEFKIMLQNAIGNKVTLEVTQLEYIYKANGKSDSIGKEYIHNLKPNSVQAAGWINTSSLLSEY